jgi:hypothetical protein
VKLLPACTIKSAITSDVPDAPLSPSVASYLLVFTITLLFFPPSGPQDCRCKYGKEFPFPFRSHAQPDLRTPPTASYALAIQCSSPRAVSDCFSFQPGSNTLRPRPFLLACRSRANPVALGCHDQPALSANAPCPVVLDPCGTDLLT